ncbi:MAG: hypothetical protein LBE38_03820 [Deltaproteobacteria bacterium]|jgi:hypothetical protein|nr:hypothetical protein [Deltaproteobacteria bacterium]
MRSRKYILKAAFCIKLTVFIAIMAMAAALRAQNGTGADEEISERVRLDSNTIATLSVGLVIQSFGYIGTYADLLSRNVYEPQQVRQMLGETIQYLSNAKNVLNQYQDRNIEVSPGDRRYLKEISEILDILIQEADSLSSFAQSHSEEDLKKYKDSRERALKLIDKLTN